MLLSVIPAFTMAAPLATLIGGLLPFSYSHVAGLTRSDQINCAGRRRKTGRLSLLSVNRHLQTPFRPMKLLMLLFAFSAKVDPAIPASMLPDSGQSCFTTVPLISLSVLVPPSFFLLLRK